MSTSDEYIIVENSENLDDNTPNTNTESEDDSTRTLANQGIFIETEDNDGISGDKHLEEFTQELMKEGGIEIVPTDKENDY